MNIKPILVMNTKTTLTLTLSLCLLGSLSYCADSPPAKDSPKKINWLALARIGSGVLAGYSVATENGNWSTLGKGVGYSAVGATITTNALSSLDLMKCKFSINTPVKDLQEYPSYQKWSPWVRAGLDVTFGFGTGYLGGKAVKAMSYLWSNPTITN